MNRTAAILDDLLGPGTEAAGDGEYRYLCPRCRHDAHKFGFNVHKGIGHCFNCDYTATVQKLFQDMGVDFKEEGPAPTLEEVEDGLSELVSDQVFPVVSLPPEAFPAAQSQDAMWYLANRRLTSTEVETYQIHYCTQGLYQYRVILPCFIAGKIRGFSARAVSPEALVKYLYPPGMAKSEILWNLDRARQYGRVIITEGVFDALAVGDDAVASLGKFLSKGQRNILISLGIKEVVLLYDSDAHDAAYLAAKELSKYMSTKIVLLNQGDPGDHSRDYLRHKIDMAQEWNGFDSMEHDLRQQFG